MKKVNRNAALFYSAFDVTPMISITKIF